jgi:transcriptional regulator with XRE-family HTH domain
MSISMQNLDQADIHAVSPHTVATAVRDARLAVGYSFEDLAVTTGLAINELEAIESGSEADEAKLKRIAAALQVPVTTFLVV